MKLQVIVSLFFVVFAMTNAEKVKKKNKNGKKTDSRKLPDSKMFDSSTLKCLVCRSLVDEFESEIYRVDPKKMVDTGTFRINGNGDQSRSVVRHFYLFFSRL